MFKKPGKMMHRTFDAQDKGSFTEKHRRKKIIFYFQGRAIIVGVATILSGGASNCSPSHSKLPKLVLIFSFIEHWLLSVNLVNL